MHLVLKTYSPLKNNLQRKLRIVHRQDLLPPIPQGYGHIPTYEILCMPPEELA